MTAKDEAWYEGTSAVHATLARIASHCDPSTPISQAFAVMKAAAIAIHEMYDEYGDPRNGWDDPVYKGFVEAEKQQMEIIANAVPQDLHDLLFKIAMIIENFQHGTPFYIDREGGGVDRWLAEIEAAARR